MKAETIETSGGAELLGKIQKLWEHLNAHHAANSPHFAHMYTVKTFAERKQALILQGQRGIHVELILERTEVAVGYCVSTIDSQGIGEIDSLFVLPHYRGTGLADGLMTRSLSWLSEQGVSRIRLAVSAGNERVFRFYAKHGFFPAKTILERM